MVESSQKPTRSRTQFIREVALFSLAGGLAGYASCWVSVLNEGLFRYFFEQPPFGLSYISTHDSLLMCGIDVFLSGLPLGAFHGVICQYSWMRRSALRTILFWTALGIILPGVLLLIFFLGHFTGGPNWAWVFLNSALAGAAFGISLAVLGKLIAKRLGTDRELPFDQVRF